MRSNVCKDLTQFFYQLSLSKQSEISLTSLKVFALYIDWMEIQLIVNELNLKLFYEFQNIIDYREGALMCLRAIINRGMIPKERIGLQAKIQIYDYVLSEKESKYDIEFTKLCYTLGFETINAFKKLQKSKDEAAGTAYDSLQKLLPLFFKLFSKIDLCEAIYEVIDDYYLLIGKDPKNLTESHFQQFEYLTRICYNNLLNFSGELESSDAQNVSQFSSNLVCLCYL